MAKMVENYAFRVHTVEERRGKELSVFLSLAMRSTECFSISELGGTDVYGFIMQSERVVTGANRIDIGMSNVNASRAVRLSFF
jgi:hypothetical protein